MHRMSLKLDKVDETDQIHSWTNNRIDEVKYKIYDYLESELKMSQKQIDQKLEDNFTIEGLVGEHGIFKDFNDFSRSIYKDVKLNEDHLDLYKKHVENIRIQDK